MPAGDAEGALEPSNARRLLVQWANQQDPWLRAVVADVLRSRRQVAPEGVDEFYTRLLIEKELAPGAPAPVPHLDSGDAAQDAEEQLTLVKLDGVSNVNALKPDQPIVFNDRLTVAFGKNGAGKSGYVRVFKRLAAVRGEVPILPNVHAATVTPQPLPHARVTYRLGAVERTVDWNGEPGGIQPLTRLDVFDATVNLLHVDEDLTFVYTPSDLALFRHVHEAIEAVRAKLAEAAKASTPTTNPFLNRFHRESRLYAKIETLGAATDVAELERLAAVTPDEAASLDGLRERVAALRPESSDSRLLSADAERRLMEQGIAVCDAAQEFDVAAYDEARAAAKAAGAKYLAATENAFAGDDIPGVLSDAWRVFVTAADAYRADVGGESYPSPGDACLYCRQTLADSALSLLSRYRNYCDSDLRKDRDDRQKALAELADAFLALNLSPIVAEIARRRELAPGGAVPAPVDELSLFVDTVKAMQDMVRAGGDVQSVGHDAIPTLRDALERRADEARTLTKTLRGQADERKRAFARASEDLRDLEARITLRDLLPEIRTYLERARWGSKAQALVPRFRGPLKSLTTAAKEASEGLVSQDFEKVFREECQALRAPNVRLDFPGRKGQAARRKAIASHRLSEILSEGEQKVIALADFLAEAQLKPAANPVIFDDPVTSLDYDRMREVTDRIVKLASRRQVIVFTHNVWFAIELLNRFEKDRDGCSYYDIVEDGGSCGIVSGGTSPRSDNLKSIRGRLNDAIAQAKKLTGEAQAALIERGYAHVRAWCEVAVETELLAAAIERYKPHVRMTVLDKIKTQALGPAIGVVVPIFERACRYIAAHSQPLETLNVRPSLSDLESDWAALQTALKTYQDAKA